MRIGRSASCVALVTLLFAANPAAPASAGPGARVSEGVFFGDADGQCSQGLGVITCWYPFASTVCTETVAGGVIGVYGCSVWGENTLPAVGTPTACGNLVGNGYVYLYSAALGVTWQIYVTAAGQNGTIDFEGTGGFLGRTMTVLGTIQVASCSSWIAQVAGTFAVQTG